SGPSLMAFPRLVRRTGSSELRSCSGCLAGLVDDLGFRDLVVVDRRTRAASTLSGTFGTGRRGRRRRVEPLRELLARGDQRLVCCADCIDVGAVERLTQLGEGRLDLLPLGR